MSDARHDANRIADKLWLGRQPPRGYKLARDGFHVVVLCAEPQEPASSFPGLRVLRCPLGVARGRPPMAYAGATDVGRQRKQNEDCVLLRPEHGLYCVADGMGGHNAGDVASKLVTASLGNFFEATAQAPAAYDLPDDYAKLQPDARRLAAGVRKANHDVFTISNTHAQHHGMGSTCVAIYVAGCAVHIAHVGDSRCYRIRDGEIQQMTRDHSLINDVREASPGLNEGELARLPKNIITRALGMKDAVKVDIRSEPILPGDTFLLCSDGLTGMLGDAEILAVVGAAVDLDAACEALINEANRAGGTDNISAVLCRVKGPIQVCEADLGRAHRAAHEVALLRRRGARILVTCSDGLGSSALVMALVLHYLTGQSGSDCAEHVRRHRPGALQDASMYEALCRLPRTEVSP